MGRKGRDFVDVLPNPPFDGAPKPDVGHRSSFGTKGGV